MFTVMYYPLIVFADIVVRLFQNYLILAISLGTIIGKLFMLKVFPMIKRCFSVKVI